MDGILTVGDLRASGMARPLVDLLPRIDGLVGLRQTAKLSDPRLTRIHAAIVAAPSGAILSGWAAAVLHGIPGDFLDGTSDGTKPLPVEFIVPPDSGAYERDGIRLRWAPCRIEDLVRYHGQPVTNGMRTAADLTRWALYPEKALAAVDMSLRYGLTTQRELERVQVPRMKGYRGIQLVRDAITVASDRAESPGESELRYYWLESGLPSPNVNADVFDLRGRFMGRIDLMDHESGYGAEYNGHWHEMWDRPEMDRRRLAGLRSLNLTVDEFNRVDVGSSGVGRINSRFRDGYALAVARDGRHDAFRTSTSSPGLGESMLTVPRFPGLHGTPSLGLRDGGAHRP